MFATRLVKHIGSATLSMSNYIMLKSWGILGVVIGACRMTRRGILASSEIPEECPNHTPVVAVSHNSVNDTSSCKAIVGYAQPFDTGLTPGAISRLHVIRLDFLGTMPTVPRPLPAPPANSCTTLVKYTPLNPSSMLLEPLGCSLHATCDTTSPSNSAIERKKLIDILSISVARRKEGQLPLTETKVLFKSSSPAKDDSSSTHTSIRSRKELRKVLIKSLGASAMKRQALASSQNAQRQPLVAQQRSRKVGSENKMVRPVSSASRAPHRVLASAAGTSLPQLRPRSRRTTSSYLSGQGIPTSSFTFLVTHSEGHPTAANLR
ncbi:hypothetical protein BV22DRAFT_74738 [Leucogyrophana mollusca]|uniref:Uncharacterized protein n=1 Tax=Leucogyrophana mollusca TaxID=85980 RepID=A0ACB8BWR9_9AGAM|nr:hypothetical protein BV22DRAFT_74738 [Leucogyrophana mollusca]